MRPGARKKGWNSRSRVLGGDRIALIGDRERQRVVFDTGADDHGPALRAMAERIGEQVGEELGDAAAVAGDRPVERDLDVDRPARLSGAQFGDHLDQRRREIGRLALDGDAAAEPPARQIEDIVDQARHPPNAAVHQLEDRAALLVERGAFEQPRAALDRGERVPEIVAEHGDELLAQLGALARVEQSRFARRQLLAVRRDGRR